MSQRWRYEQRIQQSSNPVNQRLFQLMAEKKTNLALALDLIHQEALLDQADRLGPYICALKTHIDMVVDFEPSMCEKLLSLARKHQFLLFEDRKFADIGHTAVLQYTQGIYRIADWADVVTVHALAGPGMLAALASEAQVRQKSLLLLAQMSSQGNLLDRSYQEATVAMMGLYPSAVMGLVCQSRLLDDPGLINWVPGVKLKVGEDAWGQRYITVEEAIVKRGADVVIVGRGIYESQCPVEQAQIYRQASWEAYSRKLEYLD